MSASVRGDHRYVRSRRVMPRNARQWARQLLAIDRQIAAARRHLLDALNGGAAELDARVSRKLSRSLVTLERARALLFGPDRHLWRSVSLVLQETRGAL